MPSWNGNGGRSGAAPPDIEDLVRQGQDRLKQMMPGGGPRGAIVLVVLVLVAQGAWTAYYTVPSDDERTHDILPLLNLDSQKGDQQKGAQTENRGGN